jgi:putative endonuclease
MPTKDDVGRHGEQVALAHLRAREWLVLDRNWRCREGEIDIVALDGPTLVFVEVKTRSSLDYGSPAEAVGRVKANRIRRLALHWIAADRAQDYRQAWSTLRFDVVSVLRGAEGRASVDHVEGAF